MGKKADQYWGRGEPMVWVSGGALAAILLGAITLLVVLLLNGLSYFWPSRLEQLQLVDGRLALGRRMSSMSESRHSPDFHFRTANKGFDPNTQAIRRINYADVVASTCPPEAVVVERLENSEFYGVFDEVRAPDLNVAAGDNSIGQLHAALRNAAARRAEELDPLLRQIAALSQRHNAAQTALRALTRKKERIDSAESPDRELCAAVSGEIAQVQAEIAALEAESRDRVSEQSNLEARLRRNVAVFHDAEAKSRSIALMDILRVYQPNSMGLWAKVGHYLAKVWEFLATPPRESNTEGGVLPALFGTVTLIVLMALCSFPLGVLAGIYLGEYAQDGVLVRLVRVGVNNLAGIPSIVYGIFGVGFFIDFLGSSIDRALYLSQGPVFGTGGVLWASLTLGLLTVPVVIVATEEAIRVIPRGVRESSHALGATKFQTLVRVILPLASPGILTGFILAMARAAGEVAPLMLTGVVESAPPCRSTARSPTFIWSGSSCILAS